MERQREETEGEQDKDGRHRGRCRDNKEDVIPASLLQHSFSLYSLIFSFLLFALPLIFSFYYSSSLFLSLSLVFISLSLSLSVVQTLRQMSHEIFAIKTQCVSVYVCVWVASCAHACECVRVLILTLALKSVRSTSRSGR